MPGSVPLDRLQRWMQAVVVHPGTIDEALESPAAVREIARAGDAILPSPTLEPAKRVGIYHGMYLLRMRDALATDYPGLEHFLGSEGFAELVRDYVQVYPSRSYSLNRLGDRLPEFLMNRGERARRGFLVDLARLELAVTESFDAPEAAPLAEAQVASLGAEDWEHVVLEPVPSLRLVALRYNANDYLQSLKEEDHGHPRPRLRGAFVAVYRRDYAVYRHALARPAYELLSDVAGGAPLGAAIKAALERDARRRPRPEQLSRWFRDWVAAGVFTSIRRLEG